MIKIGKEVISTLKEAKRTGLVILPTFLNLRKSYKKNYTFHKTSFPLVKIKIID